MVHHPGGVDDAVPARERQPGLDHRLQGVGDLVAIIGMLVRQ
jgi:hypothetical protein